MKKPTQEESARVRQAQEAASRRSRGKKNKHSIKYYLAGGFAVGSTVFAIWLGLTESSAPGKSGSSRLSQDTALVNDRSFVKGVIGDAAGNFTAAASPFFDGWTYGDVKYGLDGVDLRGEAMIGMPGAIQRCELDDDLEGGALPTNFDVREAHAGCFSDEVYDAGNCSSSYAISAATALASRFCIQDVGNYKNLRLSPQQIISCDKKSKGCKGGGIDSVWGYLERRGLYSEECVPFAGAKQTACKTDCDESKKLKALNHCLLSASEKQVKREIFNRGPVVAPIRLQDDFLVYEGGVYTPTKYAKPQMGSDDKTILHAVTLIGWGKAEGVQYWIVANSWGSKWGEKGFARIAFDTIVRENLVIVGNPATQEAVAEEQRKEEARKLRLEEAKKERAAREERIREAQKIREEEEAAAQDAADLTDLDNDDLDDDIEDLDMEGDDDTKDEM